MLLYDVCPYAAASSEDSAIRRGTLPAGGSGFKNNCDFFDIMELTIFLEIVIFPLVNAD
jgi:hypothetical protein